MPAEKVQKLMAQAGLGSRRACEQTIRQGRVSVNGQIVRLGERADLQTDEVRVDGVPLRSSEPLTYIALHKPPGVLSSSQSQGTSDGARSGGIRRRLYPVGRLDLTVKG
jgi:23S rRNA pseudouridine2605 synthase